MMIMVVMVTEKRIAVADYYPASARAAVCDVYLI